MKLLCLGYIYINSCNFISFCFCFCFVLFFFRFFAWLICDFDVCDKCECICACSRMCLSIHACLHACMYGIVVMHCIDDYLYAHEPAQTH